jgi:uncharacterized SAM-binding protein YcdF (DUF218 family)
MIGNHLVIQDELKPVDVIHVIAGADYRTNYAIQLYNQGFGNYLYLHGHHGGHREAIALAQGVPLEAIILDEDSYITSTYSETMLLKSWIDQSSVPIHSVIVVSDPFHMRRSQWTHRKVLGEGIEILMAPVPFDQTPFQRIWWEDSYSKAYVKTGYIKSVFYVFRYQLAWRWLSQWLAQFDKY